MSHIPVVILAYTLNGIAILVDKVMLSKHIPDPLIYIFYFSAFSCLALFVLPFTSIPTLEVFMVASISTLLWTTGAYFMFKGLQIGQPSRVIPVIGSFVPILLIIYYGVIYQSITQVEMVAASILTVGMICLVIQNFIGKFLLKEVLFEVLAAIFFAFSYIILKSAYDQADFLTVLIWSRLILIPVGLTILILPVLRKRVFSSSGGLPINLKSKVGILFLSGQAAGGASELLLTYSISLANPALVNSLQGTQYAFLFIANLFLSKKYPDVFEEKLNILNLLSKISGIILIGIGLYMLAFTNR